MNSTMHTLIDKETLTDKYPAWIKYVGKNTSCIQGLFYKVREEPGCAFYLAAATFEPVHLLRMTMDDAGSLNPEHNDGTHRCYIEASQEDVNKYYSENKKHAVPAIIKSLMDNDSDAWDLYTCGALNNETHDNGMSLVERRKDLPLYIKASILELCKYNNENSKSIIDSVIQYLNRQKLIYK